MARCLQPAAFLYGAVATRRLRQTGERASVPVICIGNVTLGGAGKTPTAIAVATLLQELGRRPGFLTRGYGGRLAGPVLVRPEAHGAGDVGDEALLLARHGPTFVSRARPAGARLAAASGVDVLVMDDGMQNPSLAKDFSLAVFDGAVGIGNGRVFPAGPLRAPLAAQRPLADAVLVIGQGDPPDGWRDLPVLRAVLAPDADVAASLHGRRIIAFAGIGRPEKFFDTVRSCGAELVSARPFPDHHAFSARDLARLRTEAERLGATLITTEKDFVRLAPMGDPVATLPVTLRFDEPSRMRSLLEAALARAGQLRVAGEGSPSRRSTASGET